MNTVSPSIPTRVRVRITRFRPLLLTSIIAMILIGAGAAVSYKFQPRQPRSSEQSVPGFNTITLEEVSGLTPERSSAGCAQVASAPEKPAAAESNDTGVSPPNAHGPTLAEMGLFVDEIPEINAADNTLSLEGFLDIVWCDPRLAFDATAMPAGQNARKYYLESAAEDKLKEIWWPDITFPNEVGAHDQENLELSILPNGTVVYQEKFSLKLEANFDLHQFPFDHQRLAIEAQSFAWPADVLVVQHNPQKIGFREGFEIPEWQLERVESRVTPVQEIRDRAPFSELLMTLDVTRQSGFFVWKVIAPLVLLVIVSWVVFWTTGTGVQERLALSFTGILTVVAYQFIVADSLPKIPYFTLMDSIITISFVLMVFTIFESLIVHILEQNQREDLALRVDRASRGLFPVAYGVSLAFVAVGSGLLM